MNFKQRDNQKTAKEEVLIKSLDKKAYRKHRNKSGKWGFVDQQL